MKLEVNHPKIGEYLEKNFSGQEKRIEACKAAIEKDKMLYIERLEILLKQMVNETINHVIEDDNYQGLLGDDDDDDDDTCNQCGYKKRYPGEED